MKRRQAVVFLILTVLLLGFIWGQSLLPREASAGESGHVMSFLKPILDPKGRIDDDAFHHYLRKAAHFAEYAALGFCVGGFVFALRWRRPALRIPASVGACAAAASVDECIQLFVPGRGGHVRDVLLDVCGAVFGAAVLALLAWLFRKYGKR